MKNYIVDTYIIQVLEEAKKQLLFSSNMSSTINSTIIKIDYILKQYVHICRCGYAPDIWKTKAGGKGYTIKCSNLNCGITLMASTEQEAITKWNHVMD